MAIAAGSELENYSLSGLLIWETREITPYKWMFPEERRPPDRPHGNSGDSPIKGTAPAQGESWGRSLQGGVPHTGSVLM